MTMTKICPHCGAEVEIKVARCPNCGYDFANGNKNVASELGLAGLVKKASEKDKQSETPAPIKTRKEPVTNTNSKASVEKHESASEKTKLTEKKPTKKIDGKIPETKRKHQFIWLLFPLAVLILASVYIGISSQQHPLHKQDASSTAKVQKKAARPKKKSAKKTSKTVKPKKTQPAKTKKPKKVARPQIATFLQQTFVSPQAKYFVKGNKNKDYRALHKINSSWNLANSNVRIQILDEWKTGSIYNLNYLVHYRFSTGVKQTMLYQNGQLLPTKSGYTIKRIGGGSLLKKNTHKKYVVKTN